MKADRINTTLDVSYSDRLQLMAAWSAVMDKYYVEDGAPAATSQYDVAYDLFEGICFADAIGAPAPAIAQMMESIKCRIAGLDPNMSYKIVIRRWPEIVRGNSFESGRSSVRCSCRLHFQSIGIAFRPSKDDDAGESTPVKLVPKDDGEIVEAKKALDRRSAGRLRRLRHRLVHTQARRDRRGQRTGDVPRQGCDGLVRPATHCNVAAHQNDQWRRRMTITVNINVHGTTIPVTVSDSAIEAVRYQYSTQFNNADMDALKLLAAAFITKCEEQRDRGISQVARAASVAITSAEDAAMWAGKAVTYKP